MCTARAYSACASAVVRVVTLLRGFARNKHTHCMAVPSRVWFGTDCTRTVARPQCVGSCTCVPPLPSEAQLLRCCAVALCSLSLSVPSRQLHIAVAYRGSVVPLTPHSHARNTVTIDSRRPPCNATASFRSHRLLCNTNRFSFRCHHPLPCGSSSMTTAHRILLPCSIDLRCSLLSPPASRPHPPLLPPTALSTPPQLSVVRYGPRAHFHLPCYLRHHRHRVLGCLFRRQVLTMPQSLSLSLPLHVPSTLQSSIALQTWRAETVREPLCTAWKSCADREANS